MIRQTSCGGGGAAKPLLVRQGPPAVHRMRRLEGRLGGTRGESARDCLFDVSHTGNPGLDGSQRSSPRASAGGGGATTTAARLGGAGRRRLPRHERTREAAAGPGEALTSALRLTVDRCPPERTHTSREFTSPASGG